MLADAAADTLARTAHGFITGLPVRGVAIDSVVPLPTGIVASTTYYANRVDADTIKLYDTYANAVAGGGTGLVNISVGGVCAIRAWYGGTFNINDRPVIPRR